MESWIQYSFVFRSSAVTIPLSLRFPISILFQVGGVPRLATLLIELQGSLLALFSLS